MVAPSDTIQIENVVASTGIGQEFDLKSLEKDLPTASYDPSRFPGVVYRTQDPKAASLVFRSGKIVTTGAESENAIYEVLSQLFDQLADLGIDVPDEPDPTIQNIVSSADLGHRLNLNAIAIGLGLENVEYDPEQFPGLVYRFDQLGPVVLLFGSGKLVITGATQPEEAVQALTRIREQLDDLELLD
jgi:transcription initiation factor TFIID TATA-box-binding protein